MLFAVYIRVSRKLQAGTKQTLLGQNVFPLESLKPGNLHLATGNINACPDLHTALMSTHTEAYCLITKSINHNCVLYYE